jgi:hypothetical protein
MLPQSISNLYEGQLQGIGRKLLEKALDGLDTPYAYAFVEPETTAA